ncbi:biopolymer transporter ExbD [Bacteriovorax sp. Seq25_V]|uniref:biopolymer transporter ExbD n=1 Tax=Bacteriovorax sp. Seq25_V TaxID=1201288 RepID=UPI00038A1C22|nr:biopolymer transporter ExbD [Bacteriovorax sp. Seq25_V]EQC44757.1 transport energizing protein, ExbD/TolR family [Bacteriovorax sp. Seq25_V]
MRKGSIRFRGVRKKREVIDIDITSLLDILVILLVFLLRSYDSAGVILNIPKDIVIPTSQSSSLNNNGVVVQVSPKNIWVDDKEVVNNETTSKIYSADRRLILPLYNELVSKKNEVQRIAKTTPNADKFSGVVNLVIDKTVKYSYIKKLMHTCAEAGFQKYKFVVMGQEQM